MWVLTEDGDLVNLNHIVSVVVVAERPLPDGREPYCVAAFEPGRVETHHNNNEYNSDTFPVQVTLCTCDDEEHGKRIIGEIAHQINIRTMEPGYHGSLIVMDLIVASTRREG